MHMLVDGLKKELEKYEKKIQMGDLTPTEWDCVFKAAKGYKDLLTVMAMNGEDMDGEYSERNYSNRHSYRGQSMMPYPPMYYDDYGYASRNGRYSNNYSGNYNNNGSRSDEKEHLKRQIEAIMNQLNEMN